MDAESGASRMDEVWGGLAAALVVLPSSVAFGIVVCSPLGAEYSAAGALAGLAGSVVVGLVAPVFGGTRRLVSGPCAPAAAVLSALALQLTGRGIGSDRALLLLALTGLAAGVLQFIYGAVGGGRLIKYIPYPVVTGYLTGVGLLIFLSQLPKLFGLGHGVSTVQGLLHPEVWSRQSLTVGLATITMTLAGPRLTKSVPASIIGIAGGVAAYFCLAFFDRGLLTLAGNGLVIGPVRSSGAEALRAAAARWSAWGSLTRQDLVLAAGAALTLSILLSIDTLKTCVVIDTFSETRHDSNRELRGQGAANVASALCGGMAGAGQMGATLVNIQSGGQTRLSSFLEGVFCLAFFAVLGRLVAWVPVAALAGILIIVAFRMFDVNAFTLLKQKATVLDFFVVLAVVVVAVFGDLIIASGVGVALAILLFIREQMGASVIRRKVYGNSCFSKQKRVPSEIEILERCGDQTVICELQGSLFFGTTDQLYTELEKDLASRRYVVLDMRRVQSVDFTAIHVLEQMQKRLAARGGRLVFSDLPPRLPTGLELGRYFDQLGLVRGKEHARVFPELDDALAWTEKHILRDEKAPPHWSAPALGLENIEFLQGFDAPVLAALRSCLGERSFTKGSVIFQQGDAGDELFIVRRGRVRIVLPLSSLKGHHVATFARGDSFGEVAFLDGGKRTADAVAAAETDLFVLSRKRFDEASRTAPGLSGEVFERVARTLANRLRQADLELRALQDG